MTAISSASPLNAAQRHSYTETPDAAFYSSFQQIYEEALAGKGSTADALGTSHRELSAMRGVSSEAQATYAAILDKAYSTGAMNDPQKFLQSLSAQEMEAVRLNHCLAEPINVASLSEEGASNLLLPEGHSVDLNHDGMEEVGAAMTIHFPPRDAPADFKEAWFKATENMDEGSMMTYQLQMHIGLYGIPVDGSTGTTDAATDQLSSYTRLVDNILASLDATRGLISASQYQRDKAFYTQLQSLLAA